jgi:pimeloyl-ACP methyl ester carboxylesterase
MTTTFADWIAAGSRRAVVLARGRREIFVRTGGSGAWCTLLHGFPTASSDWADVWDDVTGRRTVLAFDFLGFGDSDKPAEHDYTIHEQADLTEALWRQHGVASTALVAHDYGVSVAQELLARQAADRIAARITNVVFMNGGLYPELHRALPGQLALLDPEQGPQVSRMVTEETFSQSMRVTYGRQPSDALLHEQWNAVAHRDGHRIGHRLVRYIRDRERHADRWIRALETATVPRAFVWGMLDPVSGAHMAERIQERLPEAPLVRLADVGHWPQLEASDLVRLELRTHVP